MNRFAAMSQWLEHRELFILKGLAESDLLPRSVRYPHTYGGYCAQNCCFFEVRKHCKLLVLKGLAEGKQPSGIRTLLG